MRLTKTRRNARLSTAFIILLLSIGQPVTPEVAMSVTAIAGFDGFFRAGEWVPVSLSVENLARRFEGEVHVSLRWGERFSRSSTEVSFRRRVSVGSGTGELIPFVLPLNNPSLPVTIRFLHDDGSAERHEVTLRSRSVRGKLVVALSRRPNLDRLLGNETFPTTVAYPLPGYLPAEAAGYDGVSAVVVHDVDLSGLDETRIAALERWVLEGGTIVISGGPSLLSRIPGAIERFVPLQLTGVTVAEGAEGIVGWPEDRAVPIVTVNPGPETPRVLARSGDLPLVTEHARGNGRIVFLAFDYAALADLSAEAWNELLSSRGGDALPIEIRRRIFESPILADILDLPLYEFPSFGFVAGFVVAYAATAAMVLLGRSVRWTVIPTVVAVAVAFGIGGYLWLNELQQPAAALFMEYEEIRSESERPVATVSKDIVIFSTQRNTYEVSLPGGTPIPLEDRDLSVLMTDAGFSLTDIEVGRWSLQNFYVAASTALPFAARAEERAGEVQVFVDNESEEEIVDAYVLYRGTAAPLGNIGPSEGASVEFVPRQDPELPAMPRETITDQARRRVIHLRARSQDWEDTEEALIVGFLTDSPLPASPSTEFHRRFVMSVLTHALEVSR